jgi:serine/threonine protein phosphatase PrpC
LGAACSALVAAANDRGGEDNITVVLARFSGEELTDGSADRITVEIARDRRRSDSRRNRSR